MTDRVDFNVIADGRVRLRIDYPYNGLPILDGTWVLDADEMTRASRLAQELWKENIDSLGWASVVFLLRQVTYPLRIVVDNMSDQALLIGIPQGTKCHVGGNDQAVYFYVARDYLFEMRPLERGSRIIDVRAHLAGWWHQWLTSCWVSRYSRHCCR